MTPALLDMMRLRAELIQQLIANAVDTLCNVHNLMDQKLGQAIGARVQPYWP